MTMTTIAAIATPAGYGGIGVIKISGPESIRIARRIFNKDRSNGVDADHLPEEAFDSHRLYLGTIQDYQNGHVIDQVLLAVMKAPRSYTKEDVVEIQAHSGPVTMQNIMELVLRSGARLAEPGEFTRRAFVNGRIDLTQAEAVMDIIRARSHKALNAASAQLTGQLKHRIDAVRQALKELYAFIEVGIDFPDDVDDTFDAVKVQTGLNQGVIQPLAELIQQHERMRFFRDGISLAIVGKPNVGKSSLLNCLLQQDRAIVAEQPGTTRDVIRERLMIRGIPVDILDTAGIRSCNDHIENLGIKKARDCIAEADIALLVIDASHPPDADDFRIYHMIEDMPHILVLNKKDRIGVVSGGLDDIPEHWKQRPNVLTSAKFDQGLDALRRAIEMLTVGSVNEKSQSPLIPNLRHKLLLERSLENARLAQKGLREGRPVELVAIDLHESLYALDDVLGIRARADILDQIFEQFCIGK